VPCRRGDFEEGEVGERLTTFCRPEEPHLEENPHCEGHKKRCLDQRGGLLVEGTPCKEPREVLMPPGPKHPEKIAVAGGEKEGLLKKEGYLQGREVTPQDSKPA